MRSFHLLICSILLFFFLQFVSAFSRHELAGIFLSDNQIVVSLNYDDNFRFVLFTPEGQFVQDLAFPSEGKAEKELLGFTGNGTSWFLTKERNEEYQVVSTTLYSFNSKKEVNHKHRIDGDWNVRLSGEKIIIAPEEASAGLTEWTVYVLDLQTGTKTKYLSIPIDPTKIRSWDVDNHGGIYFISVEPENTYLEAYSSAQRLLWKQPLYERSIEKSDIKIADIDSTGRIYLISDSGEDDAILKTYTDRGSVETNTPIANLDAIVVANNGESFGLQSDKVIKISRNQKIISSWTYLPPQYGESWEEKWKRESKAAEVNASSSPDDLMMAMVYGENYEEVSEWLTAHGTEILPSLIQKTMKFPNSGLDYVLGEMTQKFPEESKKILASTFESANYDQKKKLVSYLVEDDKEVPDSVKQFLVEMKSRTEDREIAEQLLLQLGLDTSKLDSAIEQFRKGSLTNQQTEELSYVFYGNRNSAIEKLLPIVKDPSDQIRMQARTLLLKILVGFDGLLLSDDIKSDITKLASDPDNFVSDFAAIVMASRGETGFIQKAVSAVKEDPSLSPAFIDAFAALAKDHPTEADDYSEEVLSMLIQHIDSESNDQKKWELIAPWFTLINVDLPKMNRSVLQAVMNPQNSRETKAFLSQSLSAHLNKIPKKDVLKIILSTGSPEANDFFFYQFLKDVNENFPDDPEIREALRSRIIADLSIAESNSYSSLLAAFDGLVEKEDLMILLQFLDMGNDPCGGHLVNKALDLLDQIAPLPDFQERWVSLFQQTEYAVRAGKILAQDAYPPALEVMILALQSDEDFKVSARHFKPFNGAAESQLIAQLSSTNNLARNRAAEILGELKSDVAYPVIRKQFEDSLQDKKIPDSGVVVSLMYYGQNPIKEIIAELGMQKYAGKREEDWNSFPKELSKKTTQQLEEFIFKEEDPERARFLIYLLNFSAFKIYSAAILERIQKEHPVQEIRELVPAVYNTYHYLGHFY
jgi:hypothetical protein